MGSETGYSVFLTSFYPDKQRVEEILNSEKKNEFPIDVCFYWDGGFQTITQKEYGRRETVMVGGLSGKSELYDWQADGFAEGDRDGCLLDKETAMKLFGSTVPGGKVEFANKTYVVRKVIPWKQKLMLIHPENPETLYNRAFIRKTTSGNAQKDAEQFLMRNGLAGMVVSNERIKGLAFFSLFLMPAGIGLGLVFQAYSEKKKAGKNLFVYWFWTVIGMAVFLVILFVFWRNIQIPDDWIPGRWSDFNFWQEKIKRELESLKQYIMLPKTVVQAERILVGVKTIFWELLSLTILGIKKWKKS